MATDMQVTMTKTVDLARQYSQEAHKVVANQQNLAKEENKISEENTKRVHDRNSPEKIQKDEEDNKEKNSSEKDHEEKNEEKELEKEEMQKRYPQPRGHFDKSV